MKATNLGGVGTTRTPDAIAKLLAPKVIAHIVANRTTVVICIDLESRQLQPGCFAASVSIALQQELATRGHAGANVQVVVANRAFEAWILADALGLHKRGHLKVAPSFHCFEGKSGAQGKKGCVELDTLLARPYSKTADGPKLFMSLDFKAARSFANGGRGSKSLDKFLRVLGV